MSGDNKGQFAALLDEISADLTKALPPAEEPKKDPEAKPDCDEDPDNPGKKDNDKAEPMAKSFKIVLEDGTEVDAVDGSELVKALVDRVETNEAAMLKVLGEVAKVAAAQGEMIKSLQADLGKLSNEGKGRKAVVTIAEKPAPTAEDLAKAQPQGISGEEFLAKAMVAQSTGKITGLQVSIAEASINAGKPPPVDIVRAVLGDGK